jgi:hypothetical protein
VKVKRSGRLKLTCMEHEHHKAEGHDHHAMMEQDFRRRFWVVLALTIPVLILSPTIQQWFGFSLTFPGYRYLLFAMATIITFYGTWPFYQNARKALRSGVLDMSVLLSIAVSAGYLFSVGATFFFTAVDFYWEVSTLVAVLLLGHRLQCGRHPDGGGPAATVGHRPAARMGRAGDERQPRHRGGQCLAPVAGRVGCGLMIGRDMNDICHRQMAVLMI